MCGYEFIETVDKNVPACDFQLCNGLSCSGFLCVIELFLQPLA